MKKIITLLALCVFASMGSQAQFYKYSNEFLAIGTGARGLSMSGAVIASVNDVTSSFWNPAGLAQEDKKFDLGLMHSEYFAGIAKYDYAGLALPLANRTLHRTLAFSLIRFGVDDIPNTLFLFEPDGSINYNNITSFSVADYAAMISYAQKIPVKGLSLGGTVKIIHRTAGSFANSWGLGLDAGIQYENNNWRLGAIGKDITTTFNAWSFSFTDEEQQVFLETNNVVPENSTELTAPRIILGAARVFEFGKKKNVSFLPEVDLDITTDGKRNVLISGKPISIDPRIGVEAGYKKIIYLRGGIGNFQHVTNIDSTRSLTVQPNVGVGLKIKSVTIDYALTNLGDLSGSLYSNVFSLRIAIDDARIKSSR